MVNYVNIETGRLGCARSPISSAKPTKLEKGFSKTQPENAVSCGGGALCAIAIGANSCFFRCKPRWSIDSGKVPFLGNKRHRG
ncbi:hypothetical protein [Microcoleus sp. CAWBG58]|uniref:hypothetical protein n=1 Tax=Microcoleus sp. CAWBG58 TaxID=2841651 RepID=UPI0025F46431|nr:hypothetical protein [Microcoleus sp. CAWBG58]